MTFLPIVDRELRVAARRRGTYWSRVGAAGAAIVVAMLVLMALHNQSSQIVGQVLFYWMAAITMLSAASGLRTTSDCLSEEKREGTLGLLFLTDLKGYDVVLGKLVANSLGSFYGILAIFPVLAMSLLLGGVAYGEFWRVVLTALNILFLSLSAGLFASAVCRDERKAVALAALLILVLAIGSPLAGLACARKIGWHYNEHFLLPSPGYACFGAFDPLFKPHPEWFWTSSALTNLYGWLFLLLACRIVPRSWQEKGRSVVLQEKIKVVTEGPAEQRSIFRRELLDTNPFYWLAARDRLKVRLVWGLLALLGIGWCWGYAEFTKDWVIAPISIMTAIVLHSVLKVWLATESCRRFIEDRRSGAMELLLSTPLSVDQIFRGQRLALLRQFGPPAILILMVDSMLMFAGLNDVHSEQGLWFVVWIAGMVMFAMDLQTLSWVGMWTGTTMQKANRASGQAIARVMVLPWVIFGGLLLFYGLLMSSPAIRPVVRQMDWPDVTAPLLWFAISAANNVFWTRRARCKLRAQFRITATQRFTETPSLWKRLFSGAS